MVPFAVLAIHTGPHVYAFASGPIGPFGCANPTTAYSWVH